MFRNITQFPYFVLAVVVNNIYVLYMDTSRTYNYKINMLTKNINNRETQLLCFSFGQGFIDKDTQCFVFQFHPFLPRHGNNCCGIHVHVYTYVQTLLSSIKPLTLWMHCNYAMLSDIHKSHKNNQLHSVHIIPSLIEAQQRIKQFVVFVSTRYLTTSNCESNYSDLSELAYMIGHSLQEIKDKILTVSTPGDD